MYQLKWSFGPEIDKVLKFYPALVSYFISIDECPKVLQKLLSINADTGYRSRKLFLY